MFKKQWVINDIFSEKAKEVINFLGQLGSEIFPKSEVREIFFAPNV